MIQIRDIPETTCELYNPDGFYVGDIKSHLSLNDVRLQIAREKLKGYYLKWNDKIIPIRENGELKHWDNGFYDELSTQLYELAKLRRDFAK